MASLTRRIAHNMIYQIVGKILSTIFGLVALAMMTRYLGQEGFGGYTTIIAFLQFFGILVDFGLTLTTVQMISEPKVEINKITGNLFTLRFFSALIFLGLAPILVLFFPYSATIKIGVAITTFSFLFIALNQILIGVFQKNLRMDKVMISENVGRIVLVGSIATAIYFRQGLLVIMGAVIAGSVANFLINFIFSLKYARIKFAFDFSLWKEILRRSWPIGLSIAFNLIYLKADTIILSVFKSQAEVGLYGASYRVLDVLTTFPMMFVGLLLPVLTASWTEKNFEKLKRIIQKAFDFLVMIAVPIIFGTFFLGEQIMTVVAGNVFVLSGTILKILILAAGAIFIGTLFGHIIVAIQKQRTMIWGYATVAITSLVAYLIFIPRYSFWGAAWVTVYSESMIALLTFLIVYRTTHLLPSSKIFFKSVLASFAMSIFIWFLREINVLIIITLGAALYFGVLYLLKGYTKETVNEIFKLRNE
jgi:O-antigen/teichoic acid export membrane protein